MQVTKNADNTLTVTATAKEQKILKRWADESARSIAKQVEVLLDSFLQTKAREYLQADGPTMRAQYDALTDAQRAQVDAILATAVVP